MPRRWLSGDDSSLEDAVARMTVIAEDLEKESAKEPTQLRKRTGNTVLEGYTKSIGPGAEPGKMAKARWGESKTYAQTVEPIKTAKSQKDGKTRVRQKAILVTGGKVAVKAAKPIAPKKPKAEPRSSE